MSEFVIEFVARGENPSELKLGLGGSEIIIFWFKLFSNDKKTFDFRLLEEKGSKAEKEI